MRVRAVALLMPLILAACATPAASGPSAAPSTPGASPAGPPASASASSSAAAASSPVASIDPNAGKERTDEHGVAQVWVPAGTFLMGTDETDPAGELAPPDWAAVELLGERPQHEVALSTGYWIDKTEVTNQVYQAFVDDGGYQDQALWSEDGWAWLADRDATALPAACVDAKPDEPRVCITWYEAEAYAAWRGGALPTEAQWEFAARGPASSIFPWGDEWDEAKANVVDSDASTPVGSLPEGASWVGRTRHGRQRHGVGRRLVLDLVLQAGGPRRPDRPRLRLEEGREGRLVGRGPVRGAVGIPALRGSADLPGPPHRCPDRVGGRTSRLTAGSRERRPALQALPAFAFASRWWIRPFRAWYAP